MKKTKNTFLVKEKISVYNADEETITIPVKVFETADTIGEIEDWLLAHDPEFIKRMREARKQDLEGKCITLKQLKKELNTRS